MNGLDGFLCAIKPDLDRTINYLASFYIDNDMSKLAYNKQHKEKKNDFFKCFGFSLYAVIPPGVQTPG
jgi:hypothetical protein